jgi:phage replication-related protein YjqB (UPF0714/DUF867 family)
MAYHGGGLEETTDVIARRVAAASDASYYGVVQPDALQRHVPSVRVTRDQSLHLDAFLDHVDVVITIHGYGRRNLFTSLLLGGRNRELAAHLTTHLRPALAAYSIVDDLGCIPVELQGVHPTNPVNVPRDAGVQIELPPRIRGSGPLWWDWEHGLVPHTEWLIQALTGAARTL